jgi:AraC family transcriptional regulator of adaptative response/methylated-DNA-[protein]-cysteine methyltransferase
MPTLNPPDPRICAIAERRRDAGFFYAVRTTGVYCRPGCGARLPRPQNIVFYATTAAAEAGGFRPCRRCRPDRPESSTITAACRMIEAAESPPSLAALAAQAGLSPFHFHRLFKAATGVTPKAYAQAERARRLQAALRETASVTEAIYAAGYNAPGRFYAAAPGTLGMAPRQFRHGGAGEDIIFATAPCALGFLLVARTAKGICAIALGDDAQALQAAFRGKFPHAAISGAPSFARLVAQVASLVETPSAPSGLPLDIRGTAFQHRVWAALQNIPAGQTASYSQIAETIGAPRAARAVAAACAANTLAVAIPCHRAIRADGGHAGYRWGMDRKQALLAGESAG